MAVKRPDPLVRTNYLDPQQSNFDTAGNPNLPGFDPKNVLPRSGATSHGEDKVDAEQYDRPVGELHGAGMHGSGIAWGFQISATIGQPGVTFAPGIALEPAGKHIYLAVNGLAEIGPGADQPGASPDLVTATNAGVVLPTAPMVGDYFAVVQWWETFDQNLWYGSGGTISQLNHTPWLQLIPAANYDPDKHVVLGKVTLDANSNVTALTCGGQGELQRSSVTVPAQSVRFRRAMNSAGPVADSIPWGEVRAREGGGLQMAVQNAADSIEFLQDNGQNHGNFTKMSVAASYLTARNAGGVESMVMDTGAGVLQVGNHGQRGEVWAINDQGNYAVTLYAGQTAEVIVGGPGNAGKVRVKNVNRVDQVVLDGQSGSAIARQLNSTDGPAGIIDVGARFFHIHAWDLSLDGRSGGNKRALVDGNNKLIVNYAGDYGQGVEVGSDLKVDGTLTAGSDLKVDGTLTAGSDLKVDGTLTAGSDLKVDGTLTDRNGKSLMGNPVQKVEIRWLYVAANVNWVDIDLGSAKRFTAFGTLVMINSTTNFDYDNAAFVDILLVDGTEQSNWIHGCGSNLGCPGDPRNMHAPSVSGFGQVIRFRVWAVGPDIDVAALAIVFYE